MSLVPNCPRMFHEAETMLGPIIPHIEVLGLWMGRSLEHGPFGTCVEQQSGTTMTTSTIIIRGSSYSRGSSSTRPKSGPRSLFQIAGSIFLPGAHQAVYTENDNNNAAYYYVNLIVYCFEREGGKWKIPFFCSPAIFHEERSRPAHIT